MINYFMSRQLNIKANKIKVKTTPKKIETKKI